MLTMKTPLLLASLCLLSLPARAQTACPSHLDSSEARETLESLFNAEEFAQERVLRGRSALIDGSAIRVLTDAQDASVCRALTAKVQADTYINAAPWKSVFYQADGWYFVVTLKYPLEQYAIRVENNLLSGTFYFKPVDAYDANMSLIERWGV